MNYLYCAYGVTWAIHITYMITLARRYSRLKREAAELNNRKK